ncbi:cof-like hydrolase [Enterococcus phoeniculicola]|jgi:Cof subfamily protein (haloacid dehalogenase superfamily)|uniref:Cof-like hydrolase n=1 Tax=Enterococcus phoeniculicola ATCC BAA-412 TaxID=1158610 RepID=R3WPS2_9ENTE|nr:Cof-type HAD-IIB family hydrolase [Enterococcus phoeniculicola]EOL43830.1 cof-like hydrolase [Enterococcus phoeniculicola ATCC BAA-412]EOT76806.1 HAD superfamily hydrolase [Enterococcus phoeniculicola ATCC BAA-412]OJG69886.1 cof-like hydrolase [Enterococcus phoeniculicola]
MTIKAIVLDIDGTLLTSEKKISEKTKQSLIHAQKKGVKVILASGRPTSGMLSLAKELLMDVYEGFLVSYNGAVAMDCLTHQPIFSKVIPNDSAKKILNHLKQFQLIPMINDETYMYVNDVYNNQLQLPDGPFNIIEYESRGGQFLLCEVKDLAEFVDFPLYKILIAGDPEYLQQNHLAIKEPFLDQVTAAFSAPFYFEFTMKGIDKAKALNEIAAQLSITQNEILSFGDGQNDRSIIEYAGTGIAMGNAVDELKEIADDVTLSNDEDGIAVALEKYL